jgi:hypothetical protein
MNEPRKLKRVVIKEELVELTGHHIKALILNQLIYWSERVRDFDLFLRETQQSEDNLQVEPLHGWIYKDAKELAQELMIDASHQTIRRYMQSLVADGYIQERHNPHKAWDRTMQYRVDLVAVSRALNEIGYALEGYALYEGSIVHFGQSNLQSRQSSVHHGDSNVHHGRAIPEIKTNTNAQKKEKRPPAQGNKKNYRPAEYDDIILG